MSLTAPAKFSILIPFSYSFQRAGLNETNAFNLNMVCTPVIYRSEKGNR